MPAASSLLPAESLLPNSSSTVGMVRRLVSSVKAGRPPASLRAWARWFALGAIKPSATTRENMSGGSFTTCGEVPFAIWLGLVFPKKLQWRYPVTGPFQFSFATTSPTITTSMRPCAPRNGIARNSKKPSFRSISERSLYSFRYSGLSVKKIGLTENHGKPYSENKIAGCGGLHRTEAPHPSISL
jgi:hypothetical protein